MSRLITENTATFPEADGYHAIVGPREMTIIEKRKAFLYATVLIRDGCGLCTGGARGIDLEATKGYINAGGIHAVIWILAQHPTVNNKWHDGTRQPYIIPWECVKYLKDHLDAITVLLAPYNGSSIGGELVGRTKWVLERVKKVWIPKDPERKELSKGTQHTFNMATKMKIEIKIY